MGLITTSSLTWLPYACGSRGLYEPQSLYIPKGDGPAVYFAYLNDEIKIGSTGNLRERFTNLRCQWGHELVCAAYFKHPFAGYIEWGLHQLFYDSALGHEWFMLDINLLKVIDGINSKDHQILTAMCDIGSICAVWLKDPEFFSNSDRYPTAGQLLWHFLTLTGGV